MDFPGQGKWRGKPYWRIAGQEVPFRPPVAQRAGGILMMFVFVLVNAF